MPGVFMSTLLYTYVNIHMYTNTKTKKKELLLYWSEQREGRREGDKIMLSKFTRVSLCVKEGKRCMYEGNRCIFYLKSEAQKFTEATAVF